MVDHNISDDLTRSMIGTLRELPPADPRAVQQIVSAAIREAQVERSNRKRAVARYWQMGGIAAAAAAVFVVGLTVGRHNSNGKTPASEPTRREAAVVAGEQTTARLVGQVNSGETVLLGSRPESPTTFRIHAPSAKAVSVVGDFNGWNPSVTPLSRVEESDIWSTAVTLTPGRHTYAFVVDGVVTPDPNVPSVRDPDYDVPVSALIVREP